MLKCPNCGSRIPFWKPWFLTKYNCITCSSCGKKLKLSTNKKINSLISGIGCGTGIIFLTVLYTSNYSFWAVAIVVLWLLCMLLGSSVFTKLEIK